MTKELSGFDFKSIPQINKKQIIDLSMCGFIDKRSNVVFTGPPGVGKSHLTIAIGREACRRGYKVKFFTAAELVNTYIEARAEKTVLRLEGHIKKCDMIIVDELGYVPFDRIGAEHLFGFFSQCYEQKSLMVTTNLPFVDWPQIFGDDERLAGALLDRLTHHVHVIEIIAKSFRLNTSLKNNKRAEKVNHPNNWKKLHMDSVRIGVILLTKVAQNSMLNWLYFEYSSPNFFKNHGRGRHN